MSSSNINEYCENICGKWSIMKVEMVPENLWRCPKGSQEDMVSFRGGMLILKARDFKAYNYLELYEIIEITNGHLHLNHGYIPLHIWWRFHSSYSAWCRCMQAGTNRHGCPAWILFDEEIIVVAIPPPAFSFRLEQNFKTFTELLHM